MTPLYKQRRTTSRSPEDWEAAIQSTGRQNVGAVLLSRPLCLVTTRQPSKTLVRRSFSGFRRQTTACKMRKPAVPFSFVHHLISMLTAPTCKLNFKDPILRFDWITIGCCSIYLLYTPRMGWSTGKVSLQRAITSRHALTSPYNGDKQTIAAFKPFRKTGEKKRRRWSWSAFVYRRLLPLLFISEWQESISGQRAWEGRCAVAQINFFVSSPCFFGRIRSCHIVTISNFSVNASNVCFHQKKASQHYSANEYNLHLNPKINQRL